MLEFLATIAYLLAFVTAIIIIFNTRSPSKAIIYLFLVLLLPVIGMIIYFTFGINHRSHKMYTKKLDIDKDAFPELRERLVNYTREVVANNKDKLQNFQRLVQFDNLENQVTSNNKTQLLINGENKFKEVIAALEKAKHHIHIEYYIVENDKIGNQIIELLKKKAQEGVQVRFIYDEFGSSQIRRKLVPNMRKAGVEAYPFYKYWWLIFANKLNYRNHRKIIIIDGEVGFVGGINISDRYINPNQYDLYWRDTHLKVEGPAVLLLQRTFLSDWNFCSEENIGVVKEYFPQEGLLERTKGGDVVQIVASGPDSDQPHIMYSLIQAATLAEKQLLITTPYFIPDDAFLSAIKIAKLSGIDVKLMVPGISDSRLVNAVAHSFLDELLEIGVDVYEYQKGFVHAKTMVCDNKLAIVGTANLDQRSFDLNFEINAMVYDKSIAKELADAFFEDLKDSTRIEHSKWKERSVIEKIFERIARLLAPMY